MSHNPFQDFINSFDETYDITISDKEFQEKFHQMNQWLQTIEKEEALEKAHCVQQYLLKAMSFADAQKKELQKQFDTTKKQIKANRLYSKF